MRKKFFAVYINFYPNSAPSNRMLAYLDAWSKMDIEVSVIFMLPDRHFSKVAKQYSNIRYTYMWDLIPIRIILFHYFMYPIYKRRLIRFLSKGDNVYVYDMPDLLPMLVDKRKELKVYHEMTEHPDVVTLGNRLYRISKEHYLDTCKSLSGLFVISTHLRDYYIKEGVKPEIIQIVNMFVDSSRFENVQKLNNSIKYIGYCGTASNKKDGVDQLIEAFSIVAQKYNDVFLFIIGKAPSEDEENENVKLVEKLNVKDRVFFKGIIPFSEMPQVLKDATILALNRPDNLQAQCGFPTKLGEYLLSGNPTVLTKVGDIPLYFKDGENAMLAEPNNPSDFALKIEWLLDHKKEAGEIGRNGKETAMANFCSIKEAKKIIDYIFIKTNTIVK